MPTDKGNQNIGQKLIDQIYTTATLKAASDTLESLAQNDAFRKHANAIVTDSTLTDNQKQTQLNYLIRTVEDPMLYDFLTKIIQDNQIWLFRSDKIDYFDQFVQNFQLLTEQVEVVYLTTSIPLSHSELKNIAVDLSNAFSIKVILNHAQDENILGGIQLRIQNMVYDLSLKSKFRQFRQTWLRSLSNTEKAVGRNQAD